MRSPIIHCFDLVNQGLVEQHGLAVGRRGGLWRWEKEGRGAWWIVVGREVESKTAWCVEKGQGYDLCDLRGVATTLLDCQFGAVCVQKTNEKGVRCASLVALALTSKRELDVWWMRKSNIEHTMRATPASAPRSSRHCHPPRHPASRSRRATHRRCSSRVFCLDFQGLGFILLEHNDMGLCVWGGWK